MFICYIIYGLNLNLVLSNVWMSCNIMVKHISWRISKTPWKILHVPFLLLFNRLTGSTTVSDYVRHCRHGMKPTSARVEARCRMSWLAWQMRCPTRLTISTNNWLEVIRLSMSAIDRCPTISATTSTHASERPWNTELKNAATNRYLHFTCCWCERSMQTILSAATNRLVVPPSLTINYRQPSTAW